MMAQDSFKCSTNCQNFLKIGILFAVGIYILRVILMKIFISFINNFWIPKPNSPSKLQVHENELYRISEQMMKSIFFLFCLIWGYKVIQFEALQDFLDTKKLWTTSNIGPWTRIYYFLEFGWYFHRLLTGPLEYRRKDFWEMNIHHVVTTMLISMSHCYGQFKIGRMIMFLHDPSDSFLAFVKSLHYLRIPKIPNVAFCLFICSWLVTRCLLFPFLPIKSCFTEFKVPQAWCFQFNFERILLLILLSLNYYWLYLAFQSLFKSVI